MRVMMQGTGGIVNATAANCLLSTAKSWSNSVAFLLFTDSLSLQELRFLFISILRSAYENMIRSGELEDRQFLSIALEASLDFAEDAVGRGEQLKDWEYVESFEGSLSAINENLKAKLKVVKACASAKVSKRARIKLNAATQQNRIERSLAL